MWRSRERDRDRAVRGGRAVRVAARFDRRTFLKLVGATAAGVVAAEAFGMTRLARAASATSPIEDLALQLDFDQASIFRFVAERIRYEPYAGSCAAPREP